MKYALAVSLIACLSLGACATVGTVAPGTGPISSGTGLASQIVTGTQTACKFVPTAATIAGVLAATPATATVDAIVNALCAAVAPLASGPGLEHVKHGYAYGVRVHGRFVN